MNPYFAIIAPEFSGEDPAPFLEMAAQRISARFFGELYPQAQAYLAAHLMALAKRSAAGGGVGGTVGAIASATTGGVSVSYQTTADFGVRGSSLSTTPYGLAYLELLSAIPTVRLVRP